MDFVCRLMEQHGIGVDLWSATSYKALREEALATERRNRLHPDQPAQTPLVAQLLAESAGPIVAVTDFMRAVPGVRVREDLYDVRNYTSFWWKDTSIEPKIFGFVLTPRQGDELADLCRKMQEEHDKDPSKAPYPQARCKVDASLYPGSAEVVEARLAGQTDEEILVIAHLCHPQASANDNASGVASAMELFRVIKRLVDQGEVPPLKRGLRMIFVPEFSGTYAWLAEEIDRLRTRATELLPR